MRDKLEICIKKPTGESYKNFSIKKGMNEIFFDCDLSSGDHISLASKSGNPFIISNPICIKHVPKPQRELIFLISVDTLAASHISLYGYKKETSPNITKFARDAVVFDHAVSNSTWTVSSHMNLFTSLLEYGHKVKVKKNYIKSGNDPFVLGKKLVFSLSPSIPTLTEYLAKNYVTFSFNGGGNVSREFGFYRGFDGYLSNGKDMNDPRASTSLFDKVKVHLETYPFPKVFYFLHTYHTHSPYNPSPEYLSKQEPKPKLSKFDYYADLGGMRGIYKPYPTDFVEDVAKLYDAEINGFDTAFGEFIDYLKSNGLYDNSTIILLSDHGEEFLEHGSWVHASDLYTEQTWIPLIIKFPFQEHKGKTIGTHVSLVDVMPTLLALKGAPVPAKLHGQSLLPLIDGKEWSQNIVISSLFRSKPEIYSPGKISIIQNYFKLIYSEPYPQSAHEFFKFTPPTFAPFELYDLSADRLEKTNILNSHRNDPSVKLMIKKVAEIIREMENSFNDKNLENSSPLSDELTNQLKTLGYF
jgi:arylsulfatase A-like enzyme